MTLAARSLLLLAVLPLGCKVATIRPIDSTDDADGPQTFDAVTYVETLWAEDVPRALEGAVDLEDLLPALESDPAGARERLGRREGSGPFHAVVKGSGRVTDVDTSSRTGLARVEIGDRAREVVLQIGPVLQGTSIRDALPTVSFGHFVNQIQYADVANALNARIEQELLASLEPEGLVGRRVSFVGMTALGEPPLTITPVRLEKVDGP